MEDSSHALLCEFKKVVIETAGPLQLSAAAF